MYSLTVPLKVKQNIQQLNGLKLGRMSDSITQLEKQHDVGV